MAGRGTGGGGIPFILTNTGMLGGFDPPFLRLGDIFLTPFHIDLHMMPGYDAQRMFGIILYKSINFGTKLYVVNSYFSRFDIFMGPNFRYRYTFVI